jgi:LmeA-like phospholipid-binding
VTSGGHAGRRIEGSGGVARRGRRVGIVFVVLIAVLAGLFVAADRAAASAAEQEIAKQTVKEMNARGITADRQPTADVGGFPFLTQVLAGRYEKVTIKVDHPQAQKVRLEHLTLIATDVRAATDALISGKGQITSDRVTGVATIGWDGVRSLLDLANLGGVDPKLVQLTVRNNLVSLRVPLLVLGQPLTVIATGTVEVARGVVRLHMTDVGLENREIPAPLKNVIDTYKQKLSVAIQVPALPYRLSINTVESTESGLLLNAAADDVVIAG